VFEYFFMSDTHCEHETFFKAMEKYLDPSGNNILIHCGDWTQLGHIKQTEYFCSWLKYIKPRFKHIIVVAGNHERICDHPMEHSDLEKFFNQIAIYLSFKAVTFKQFGNLTILGLSWWDRADIAPVFNDFKTLPPMIDESGTAINGAFSHTNILVSHHPPYGIMDDWHGNHNGSKRIVGYLDLLDGLNCLPSHHIFGHVHRLGKRTNEIMEKSQKHPSLTHINVAQSVGFFDFFYN